MFVGGLRMGEIPGTGHLQRILFNENMEELRREMLLVDLRQRIRDVKQGPDELLYVLTGENDGAVIRIEPAQPSDCCGVRSENRRAVGLFVWVGRVGRREFAGEQPGRCFDAGERSVAPALRAEVLLHELADAAPLGVRDAAVEAAVGDDLDVALGE